MGKNDIDKCKFNAGDLHMKCLIVTAAALGISLCAPVVVYAHDMAPAHKAHHVYHVARATIPASATALALPIVPKRDSDGLSRDRENCNTGCIDN